MVFLCDDYLSVKTDLARDDEARFFYVAQRLPMELQMIVCNRACHCTKDLVKDKDSEAGFHCMLRHFPQHTAAAAAADTFRQTEMTTTNNCEEKAKCQRLTLSKKIHMAINKFVFFS